MAPVHQLPIRRFRNTPLSSAFDDTKIPSRRVVEHFERWPVKVTVIRGDRLLYVFELDNDNRLIYPRLVGLSRLASYDHATSQAFQCGHRKLRIFGNSGRI